MELPVYHARFYQDEPAHQSMLQAINGPMRTARYAVASEISQKITGLSILAFEYTVAGLFLTLDSGTRLHLFLADKEVQFEVIDGVCPIDEQCVRFNCLLTVDGLIEPYAWNTEKIKHKMEGSIVKICVANNASVYLDIGNAVALRVSRMYVDEFGGDVLFFDFD